MLDTSVTLAFVRTSKELLEEEFSLTLQLTRKIPLYSSCFNLDNYSGCMPRVHIYYCDRIERLGSNKVSLHSETKLRMILFHNQTIVRLDSSLKQADDIFAYFQQNKRIDNTAIFF